MHEQEKAKLMADMTRQAARMLDLAAETMEDEERGTLINLAMGQLDRVKVHGGRA